jgi:hypothetical protein
LLSLSPGILGYNVSFSAKYFMQNVCTICFPLLSLARTCFQSFLVHAGSRGTRCALRVLG